jgi:Protein of unknown function (DUF3277)
MAFIKTYAPQEVRVSWGGVSITGFADGEFITITPNSDLTDEVVGAQGDLALTKIANWTGTVTITLLQNAEFNLYFSNIYAAQQRAADVVRENLTIVDPSGSTLYECRDTHLKTAAPVTLSDGQNGKVWTLFVGNMIPVSSNSEITQALGIASQVNAAAELLGLG